MLRAALPLALLLLHVLGGATATSLGERWSRLLQSGSWYYAPTFSPTRTPTPLPTQGHGYGHGYDETDDEATAVRAVPPCAPCPAGKYGMTLKAAIGESFSSLLLHECRDCGMDSFSEVIGVTQGASCPDGWGTGGKTGSNSRFACVTAPDPTMAPNPIPTSTAAACSPLLVASTAAQPADVVPNKPAPFLSHAISDCVPRR